MGVERDAPQLAPNQAREGQQAQRSTVLTLQGLGAPHRNENKLITTIWRL